MRLRILLVLTILASMPMPAADAVAERMAKLVPLHRVKGPVQPGDWLEHQAEDGQTWAQWKAARRNLPTTTRTSIVLQPMGTFAPAAAALQDDVEAFLAAFFGLPVRRAPAIAIAPPAEAARINEHTRQPQILTDWMLGQLRAHRADDAVATLGLTPTDLWPGEGWNFVFGVALYQQRIGVWSIARYGDPATDGPTVVRRTVGVALHETGHMFTIAHCTAYECIMNGSNSLREADRAPLDACPECSAKIWALAPAADPVARYRRLAQLASGRRLADDAAHWTRCAEALAR